MGDVQVFVKIKMEEYLLTKNKTGKSTINNGDLTEINKMLDNIMEARNDEISAKHAH